jgi:hypothetical protein
MKLAYLVLAVSVSATAQSSSKAVDFHVDNTLIQQKPADPDYFGPIHHDHKTRNRILLGSAVAAGVVAAVLLTHETHGVTLGAIIHHPVELK